MMNLSPTESERLTIFMAAEFARRNLQLGIRLSQPEAVAYISDEAMLLARSGINYMEIREKALQLLNPEQVEPGVPALISLIMLELPMKEGTKLLALFDPIRQQRDSIIPGEIIHSIESGKVKAPVEELEELKIEVVNTGDRDIQVRSMTHFFEVNRALSFDRAAAYGMRLAVPAGSGVRFEPGISHTVALTPIGGQRIVRGHAGLVEGSLDAQGMRDRAIRLAQSRGYIEGGEWGNES